MNMKPLQHGVRSTLTRGIFALGAALFALGCSDSTSSPLPAGSGRLIVRLTDAPFPTSEVKSVDIFIVKVNARTADVDDEAADEALDDESAEDNGWKTIGEPNKSFDLLSLRNGTTATLGEAVLPAGIYNGFRLVIDQSKSSVTLKSGLTLDGGSTPGIKFPSAAQSGIKIVLSEPVEIKAGTQTELMVDFDVENSFVMRGNTIDKNGLLFKPVVKASITNLALTNSHVRLANATDVALTLLQNGTALPGSSNIAFGASSQCSSVNAANPMLSVMPAGGTAITLSPTLVAGHPFTFIGFPATGTTQFATLANDFAPTAGQAGLRVFNATAVTPAFDVFVTAAGAPLGTATFANVAAGQSSAFASAPAIASLVRLTNTGTTANPIELGTFTLVAGQNTTLVIAPPAANTTTLRGFLVPAC
jgi:Domain of unknown function (DUF4382)